MIKLCIVIICIVVLPAIILSFFISPANIPILTDTTTPHGSPLPSKGYIVTAYYHDPEYFKIFHKQHTGIDLVPPSSYTTRPVVLHATMTGKGYYYNDPCSGKAVIIINGKYIIYLGHIDTYLFPNNSNVSYGEPVATMGESGEKGVCVTGPHVHYQIYMKINNVYTIINPISYLN